MAAPSGTITPETAESFGSQSAEDCSVNESLGSTDTTRRSSSGDTDDPITESPEINKNFGERTSSKESSLFTSQQTSYTGTPRRNSYTNASCSSCSDLGTSLNFLFHSRSTTNTSTGSHSESPTPFPPPSPDARILDGLDRLLNRITRFG